ncbi:DUF368 domain-containing protein [Corynebacterium ulceribovis]|uniref:DUF368 domain-containing protein n=1 Tax=Corynebacterium ulceribovis TaxID=487732 RepID=UPI00036F1326|nr:DUF368 domain-containing protein [Corynebacterium ulceribovis]
MSASLAGHSPAPSAPTASKWAEVPLNLIRGCLIALAELIPGVSGGTVALVTGIYERALLAGNQLIGLVKALFVDRGSLKSRAAKIDWMLLIAVGVAMVGTIFALAGMMENFVTNHTSVARALFMGMVLVSIWVPLRMVDRTDLQKKSVLAWSLFVLAAVITFFATGFSSTPKDNPSLIVVFLAAAVAVCALVLPGVSGSFFLLAVGLYAPVMGAISDRDMSVILVFLAGAATGIILFIRLLGYMMDKHRTLTLFFMAGLLLGSLRALWPWQGDNAELLAPGDDFLKLFGFFVLGAVIVAITIGFEKFVKVGRQSETILRSGQPE